MGVEPLLGHRERAAGATVESFQELMFNYFCVWLLLLHGARVKVRGQLAGTSSLLPRSREGRQVVGLDGLCFNPLSQFVGLNALPNRSVCLNGIGVDQLTFKGWPSDPLIQCDTDQGHPPCCFKCSHRCLNGCGSGSKRDEALCEGFWVITVEQRVLRAPPLSVHLAAGPWLSITTPLVETP